MFSLNKTGEWLSSLTENERDKFLQQARSEGPKLRQLYKERTMEIETTRIIECSPPIRCSAATFNSKVSHAVKILSNTAAVVWSVFVLVERRASFNSYFFIALCKALGLCSKFITAPFWRIMEGDCTL
jgi:hypothetical protein